MPGISSLSLRVSAADSLLRFHCLKEPDILPVARDLGDARLQVLVPGRDIRQVALLDHTLEGQFFHGGIADGNDVVALNLVFRDLRRLDQDVETVAAGVDPAVFPGESSARPGVGGITTTDGIPVAAVGVGFDVDRDDVGVAVGLTGQHFEVGEVLRVIQCELGAQDFGQIKGLVLFVAQVAADQGVVDDILFNVGGTEAIALAGLQLEADRGLVGRRIDNEIVACEL